MILRELRLKLSTLPDSLESMEVQVWMPGTRIELSNVFIHEGKVMIEGNTAPDARRVEVIDEA